MTIIQAWDRIVDLEKEILKLKAERDAYQPVAETAVEYIHACDAAHHGPYGKQRDMALHNLRDEVVAFDEWEQDL